MNTPVGFEKQSMSVEISDDFINPLPQIELSLTKRPIEQSSFGLETLPTTTTSQYRAFKKSSLIFIFGFFIASVYFIIPNGDYWNYYLVKSLIWYVSGSSVVIEVFEACYPFTSDPTYVFCYFLGVLNPMIFSVAGYFFPNTRNSFSFSLFSLTGFVFYCPLIYLINVWIDPHQNRENIENIETKRPDRTSHEIGGFFDLFLVALHSDSSRSTSSSFFPLGSISLARMAFYDSVSEREQFFNFKPKELKGVARMFWFLPRYRYRASGKPLAVLEGDTAKASICQVLLGLVFTLLYISNFYFLMFFGYKFRAYSEKHSSSEYSLLSIFFLVNFMFRICLKRIGLMLDQSKKFGISLFLVAEVMSLMQYFPFYRVLFDSFTSWKLFSFALGLHFLGEWVTVPLRASPLFYQTIVQIKKHPYGFLMPDLVESKSLSLEDWQLFLSIDFSIRIWMLLASSVGMLLLFLFIDLIPWIQNSLQEPLHSYSDTCLFIVVATILEIINAFIILRYVFPSQAMSLLSMTNNCLNDLRFSCLLSAVSVIMFIQPITLFTTNNTY